MAESLETLMKERELTDSKLAEFAGVSQPTVTRIRTGISKKPELETLEKLASALGVTLPELRGEREARAPSPAMARTSAERALLEAWRDAPFPVRGAVLTLLGYTTSSSHAGPARQLDLLFDRLMHQLADELADPKRADPKRKAG